MVEIIYIPATDPMDRMRAASMYLSKWIDGLTKPQTPEKANLRWQFIRLYEVDNFGEDSVINLLPEKLEKGQIKIISLINLLSDCGYHTKKDLTTISREQLRKVEGFRTENIEVTMALAEIASAQSDLAKKKNEH